MIARADFTVTVRDTDAGCWITMRGNQTGTTIQRCVETRSFLVVLFTVARMWLDGAAKMHPERAPAIAVDRSRFSPNDVAVSTYTASRLR